MIAGSVALVSSLEPAAVRARENDAMGAARGSLIRLYHAVFVVLWWLTVLGGSIGSVATLGDCTGSEGAGSCRPGALSFVRLPSVSFPLTDVHCNSPQMVHDLDWGGDIGIWPSPKGNQPTVK